MPCTNTVECPGCPLLCALTFDALGLVKGSDKQRGVPLVVERWGQPQSSKCVMAVLMIDHESHPLLAVARKSGRIEVMNPVNGDIQATVPNANDLDPHSEENNIVGLHLFAKQNLELASRNINSWYYTSLTCTTKGNASLRSIEVADSSTGSSCVDSSKTWNVCSGGNILCCTVDGSEKFALLEGECLQFA